jgi:hypothetical protein
LAALLDPLLLLGFAVAAWRTFGARTALVCLVVYGASTFPWFGSNWAGSTLRNDWMVALGFGACALATRRWMVGGALLAAAAMIRAFPAVAVFFLAVPALWWLYGIIRQERRLPSIGRIEVEQRPILRTLAGALACVVVLTAVTAADFGPEHSWGQWSRKVAKHSTKPNVNHVGLRTVFAWSPSTTLRALPQTGGDWSVEQLRTLNARRPLFSLAVALFALLAVFAARGADLRQAALLGTMLFPIFFYLSNYYLHCVFLLPMLVDEARDEKRRRVWGLVCVIMLAVCVSEYWGFGPVAVDERYVQWSFGLLAGTLAILAVMAKVAMRSRPG